MALPFDRLAREILDVMLRAHGRLETESEAPALTAQRADVLFVPDPAHDDARRALGLLGRMTDETCLFEPFHAAPSLASVVECLRKLLNHRRARALKHTRAAQRSWLLCSGRPDEALAVLRARPMPTWPRGFYELSTALGLSLVVLAELPDVDDTLALRLTGAGETFGAAVHDLRERFGLVPQGRDLYVAVVQMVLAARRSGVPLTESVMLDVTEALEFLEQQHREGRREGRREGHRELLTNQCARRLARPLTDAERTRLDARLEADGVERVGDAVLDLDAASLAAWLADA